MGYAVKWFQSIVKYIDFTKNLSININLRHSRDQLLGEFSLYFTFYTTICMHYSGYDNKLIELKTHESN